jgi:two-component system competent response regulator ComA
MSKIIIIIVDDHPAIAYGTKMILEQNSDYQVVDVISDVAHVPDAILHYHPQLMLIDMHMPGMNGRELAKVIKTISPRTQVVIFSGFDLTPMWNQLNQVGVSGIMSKNATPRQIMRMVEAILEGETVIPISLMKNLVYNQQVTELLQTIELSAREMVIMNMVCDGFTNQQIAKHLIVSTRSAENYISKIYEKLGVRTRLEAIETYRTRYNQ